MGVEGLSRRTFLGAVAAAGTPLPLAVADSLAEPGDRRGTVDWKLHRRGHEHEIEGFADRASVLPGDPCRLYVRTTARGFRAEAFRMGWYGGALADKVWESPRIAARRQPAPLMDDATRTVSTRWEPGAGLPTRGWPEGAYLIRLTADSGAQRYVPLTVRSARIAGRLVLVSAVATWQAYNTWGGHSLYWGPRGKKDTANRSLVVSCDRPYSHRGDGKFLVYEQPVVALAERLGLGPAYVTGEDIDRDPALLTGARAVITLGHDEYWTDAMREHVTAARDAGTNLAFLGANACYRRIRYEPTRLGERRRLVCYKRDWRRDPGLRSGLPPTADFRNTTHADPENSLTGTFYESNPTTADYVVTHPGHWLFEGTGARAGTAFPGLVGTEYDRVYGDATTPRPIEVLAHSPLTCKGVRSYADSAYYTTPSGAGVFSTGTMRWVQSLAAQGGHGIDHRTAAFTTRVTTNALHTFATGPAAHTHPTHDNLDALDPYPHNPIRARQHLW